MEEKRGSVKIGDVVQLKSGGPRMTVQQVADNGSEKWVECVWFVQGDDRESARFHPDTLNVKYSEEA